MAADVEHRSVSERRALRRKFMKTASAPDEWHPEYESDELTCAYAYDSEGPMCTGVSRHFDQVVTKSAIYPRDCLPYSYGRVLAHACSLFLNLHNTGFFPDYNLLSVTDGSIWIPYLARHSEIFKKPNFQVVHRFF